MTAHRQDFQRGGNCICGWVQDKPFREHLADVAAPTKVVRCAGVEVYGTRVVLSFQTDLTPIEAVAAFLRDASGASCNAYLSPSALLYHIADQLDPPATFAQPDASPP